MKVENIGKKKKTLLLVLSCCQLMMYFFTPRAWMSCLSSVINHQLACIEGIKLVLEAHGHLSNHLCLIQYQSGQWGEGEGEGKDFLCPTPSLPFDHLSLPWYKFLSKMVAVISKMAAVIFTKKILSSSIPKSHLFCRLVVRGQSWKRPQSVL